MFDALMPEYNKFRANDDVKKAMEKFKGIDGEKDKKIAELQGFKIDVREKRKEIKDRLFQYRTDFASGAVVADELMRKQKTREETPKDADAKEKMIEEIKSEHLKKRAKVERS